VTRKHDGRRFPRRFLFLVLHAHLQGRERRGEEKREKRNSLM
jgi:hypothetical protein